MHRCEWTHGGRRGGGQPTILPPPFGLAKITLEEASFWLQSSPRVAIYREKSACSVFLAQASFWLDCVIWATHEFEAMTCRFYLVGGSAPYQTIQRFLVFHVASSRPPTLMKRTS